MSTNPTTAQRPARTYTTGPIARGLRWIGVLAALGITAWILVRYPSLPATVATHFDVSGQADDWGPRWSVLVLAGVMLLLSLGLAALSTRPRLLNYPTRITASSAQAAYREGERMLIWTLLGVQGVYGGIAWSVLLGGGMPLIATGLVVLVTASVIGIIRLVRAGR